MKLNTTCVLLSTILLRVSSCGSCNQDTNRFVVPVEMGKIKFATVSRPLSDTLHRGDTVFVDYILPDTFTSKSGDFVLIKSISGDNGLIDAYKSTPNAAGGFAAYDGFIDNNRYGDGAVNASLYLSHTSPFKGRVRFVAKDTGYYFFDLVATIPFDAYTNLGDKHIVGFIDFTNPDCHLNALRTAYPNLGGMIDDHAAQGIGLYSFYVKP